MKLIPKIILLFYYFENVYMMPSPVTIIESSESPKLQACGTDLRRLLDWLCTYSNEKLPCYSHFMDETGYHGLNVTIKKENPLLLIEKMKEKALAADDYEEFIEIGKKSKDSQRSLIEACCFEGCAISQIKKQYCCFTQNCLDLCYPGDFEIFKR